MSSTTMNAGIRMPLQTGATAMWSLASSAAALVPSFVSTLALVTIALQTLGVHIIDHPAIKPWIGDVISWFFFLGILGIFLGPVLLGLSIVHLSRFLRDLPSDLLISPGGLTVHRVLGTRTYSWREVEGAGCHVSTDREKRITVRYIACRILGRSTDHLERTDVEVARLILPRCDGGEVILARAQRPVERRSLEAVCDTIRATDTDGEMPEPGLSQEYRARIVTCPGCQAVVQPEDRDAVACSHCGTSVVMPVELRRRLRDAKLVARGRSGLETLVRSLIRQPGALRTNVYVLVCAALMFLAWPVALALLTLVDHHGFISPWTMSACLVSPPVFILGLYFILRGHTARRGALRLLTVHYGARPPTSEGEPRTCRSCGAPLREEPDRILVRCAYCGSDNILALDLRRRADTASEQARHLDEDMRAQRRERVRWAGLSFLAIFIIAASILLAVASVMRQIGG